MVKHAPCKGCSERAVGCHADCRKFRDWKIEQEKERVRIRNSGLVREYPMTEYVAEWERERDK